MLLAVSQERDFRDCDTVNIASLGDLGHHKLRSNLG